MTGGQDGGRVSPQTTAAEVPTERSELVFHIAGRNNFQEFFFLLKIPVI